VPTASRSSMNIENRAPQRYRRLKTWHKASRRFITAAQKLEAPLSTKVSLQDKSHRKLPKLSRTDWQLELQRTELRASSPEIETEFCSVSISRGRIETIPFSMNFRRADRGNGFSSCAFFSLWEEMTISGVMTQSEQRCASASLRICTQATKELQKIYTGINKGTGSHTESKSRLGSKQRKRLW
jgi:hypothetical protein